MVNIAIKFWIYGKQSATDALKTTAKWEIQKAAGETGDFTGNKIADKIMISLKKIATGQFKISYKWTWKYIFRSKTDNYWWSKINIIV